MAPVEALSNSKGSFTYHQGGGGFGMITLMLFLLYPMPNLITEGGQETHESDYVICERPLIHYSKAQFALEIT